MVIPILLLALLSSLLPTALSAATFVGCNQGKPASTALADNVPAGSDGQACAARCESYLFLVPTARYSYYDSSITNGAVNCFCDAAPPVAETYSSSSQGSPTVCADPTHYSVFRIQTTFSRDACISASPAGSTVSAPADSVSACFDSCKSSERASFLPTGPGSAVSCSCGGSIQGAMAVTCGASSVFTFNHPAYAAASQLLRRSLRDEMKRRRLPGRTQYCPAGLTPCKIPATSSYECIDTRNELESCGGCLNGVFGEDQEGREGNVTGVDCSALDGAPLGSMSCVNSQCRASVCSNGYSLVGGRCQLS